MPLTILLIVAVPARVDGAVAKADKLIDRLGSSRACDNKRRCRGKEKMQSAIVLRSVAALLYAVTD
jgi:hypothetical protein